MSRLSPRRFDILASPRQFRCTSVGADAPAAMAIVGRVNIPRRLVDGAACVTLARAAVAWAIDVCTFEDPS